MRPSVVRRSDAATTRPHSNPNPNPALPPDPCLALQAVVNKSRAGEIEARLGEERAHDETEKVRSEVYAARQKAERLHRELSTIYELRDLGTAQKKKQRPQSAFPTVTKSPAKVLEAKLGDLAKGGGGGRDHLDVWGNPKETLAVESIASEEDRLRQLESQLTGLRKSQMSLQEEHRALISQPNVEASSSPNRPTSATQPHVASAPKPPPGHPRPRTAQVRFAGDKR